MKAGATSLSNNEPSLLILSFIDELYWNKLLDFTDKDGDLLLSTYLFLAAGATVFVIMVDSIMRELMVLKCIGSVLHYNEHDVPIFV